MCGHSVPTVFATAFVEEVVFVFDRMLHWQVDCESLETKTDWAPTSFLSGVVSLSGGFEGKVALGFSSRVACRIAETLLSCKVPAVNDDVVDAICELTNTVAGRAVPRLSKGCTCIGVPQAVIGRSRPIEYPPGVNPLVIRFQGEIESFTLELGIIESAKDNTHEPTPVHKANASNSLAAKSSVIF